MCCISSVAAAVLEPILATASDHNAMKFSAIIRPGTQHAVGSIRCKPRAASILAAEAASLVCSTEQHALGSGMQHNAETRTEYAA